MSPPTCSAPCSAGPSPTTSGGAACSPSRCSSTCSSTPLRRWREASREDGKTPCSAPRSARPAAGLEIGGDVGRAEHVAAELDLEAGLGRAAAHESPRTTKLYDRTG